MGGPPPNCTSPKLGSLMFKQELELLSYLNFTVIAEKLRPLAFNQALNLQRNQLVK
jgi:hypothetical protein